MQFKEAENYILDKLKTELPEYLHYHNVEHTTDVVNACKLLAKLENLSDRDTQLLLTAACYHDAGFLSCIDGHEVVSCKIVGQVLPGYGYTADEIATICSTIMATRMPQTPVNKLGELLADADLDYLGRDDFFGLSCRLYSELVVLNDLTSEEEWDRIQVEFLKTHRYFTISAQQLRRAKKVEHLEQLKAKLNKETL
jgi:uncharacterized protein